MERKTLMIYKDGFKVEAIPRKSIAKDAVLEHWKTTWKATGFSDGSFVEGWQNQTIEFLKNAETAGLQPRTFVARDAGGSVLGSIHCQIWAGPLPWVVQPNVFRLGTLWGLFVEEAAAQGSIDVANIRKELLRAALTHLKHEQCSKVVTLAPNTAEREQMVEVGVGLQQSNMLTLDLLATDDGDSSKKLDKKHFGPAGAEYDATVCLHWQRMWQDVGIPQEALVPDMEQVTCAFLKQARERLGYQTFVARCDKSQKIVGSVSCQVWEGPFPLIVQRNAFQMGTIWAVYVDPAHRRQGVATALMRLALQHLKGIGCHSVILIAASEAGKCVYERLGFRANNALVCDLQQPAKKEHSSEVVEEKKQEESENVHQDLRQALQGIVDVAFDDQQINALRTATERQLMAVFGDLPDIVERVVCVQKKHGIYIDPQKNWFTERVKSMGKGFDMKKLNGSGSLAAKFDRLADKYDHWTGELVGVDISSGMVRRVKERGCYNRAYVSDANKNLASCQDGDDSASLYDVVICTGAMELLDQQAVLTQISKVTRPEGEIWATFQEDAAEDNPTQHQNVQGVSKARALDVLRGSGFHCVSVETCSDAFCTPSPTQNGSLLPVPYLFIVAKKEG